MSWRKRKADKSIFFFFCSRIWTQYECKCSLDWHSDEAERGTQTYKTHKRTTTDHLLTCYVESRGAAADRSQVLDGGHALVDALVGFVVFGVHDGADEQRAVGQDLPAIVQVEQNAIFLPVHLGRELAVDGAVE